MANFQWNLLLYKICSSHEFCQCNFLLQWFISAKAFLVHVITYYIFVVHFYVLSLYFREFVFNIINWVIGCEVNWFKQFFRYWVFLSFYALSHRYFMAPLLFCGWNSNLNMYFCVSLSSYVTLYKYHWKLENWSAMLNRYLVCFFPYHSCSSFAIVLVLVNIGSVVARSSPIHKGSANEFCFEPGCVPRFFSLNNHIWRKYV